MIEVSQFPSSVPTGLGRLPASLTSSSNDSTAGMVQEMAERTAAANEKCIVYSQWEREEEVLSRYSEYKRDLKIGKHGEGSH